MTLITLAGDGVGHHLCAVVVRDRFGRMLMMVMTMFIQAFEYELHLCFCCAVEDVRLAFEDVESGMG